MKDKISELIDRIDNNDNRCTAKPYLLLLQVKRKMIGNEEHGHNGEIRFVERYTGDYINRLTRDELIKELKVIYEDDYNEKIESSIEQYWEEHYWETVNVFLTDKGLEEHLKLNRHNLGEHRSFGIHAFRNPEIEILFNSLSYSENLQKENEDLKEKLAKAKEGLEKIERWSNHNRPKEPWTIASETLAELGE